MAEEDLTKLSAKELRERLRAVADGQTDATDLLQEWKNRFGYDSLQMLEAGRYRISRVLREPEFDHEVPQKIREVLLSKLTERGILQWWNACNPHLQERKPKDQWPSDEVLKAAELFGENMDYYV